MVDLEVTECPYYLMSRASLAITAMLRKELAAAGVESVRPAYLGALIGLWHEDCVKVVELGRRAGLEPSTMTGLVDRMERDGLVTREADPDDRRAQRVCLTDEGRHVREPVLEVVDRVLGRALDGISPEAMDGLKTVLRTVLANADQERSR